MEIVNREEVLPPAKIANMEWVPGELANKLSGVMAQEVVGTLAMMTAATQAASQAARIRQPASSWKRLGVCSVTKRWSRRAVRSGIRLAATVETMIPAAITKG